MSVAVTVTSTDPAITAVAVGFLDVKTGAAHDELLMANRTKQVELTGARYLVRATLPTGELITEDLDLTGAEPHQLRLTVQPQPQPQPPPQPPPTSPPRSSAHFRWLLRLRQRMDFEYEMGDADQQPGPTRGPLAPAPLDVWLRRWTFADGAWVPGESIEPRVEAPTFTPDSRTVFDVPSTGDRTAVQIGGPTVPARILVLPPTNRGTAEIAVTPGPANGFDAGLTVTVGTGRPEVDAVITYLQHSQFTAAAAAFSETVDLAESLLRAKMVDSGGSVVGGYYLLRVRALAQMHDWPGNLARVSPHDPDAHLVRAGQILSVDISNKTWDELRDRVVAAHESGIPAYVEGMRWMRTALDALLRRDESDAELALAQSALKPYADAVDWSKSITSFWGATPNSPGFDRLYSDTPDNLAPATSVPAGHTFTATSERPATT